MRRRKRDRAGNGGVWNRFEAKGKIKYFGFLKA